MAKLLCYQVSLITRVLEFIRSDIGDEMGRVFVKQKPIIAQEILSGERGTDGHVLTIEGRPSDSRTIEVQLALFNSIPVCDTD